MEKSFLFYRGSTFQLIENKYLLTGKISEEKRDTQLINDKNKLSAVKGFIIGFFASISYTFTGDDIIDSYSSNIIITAFPNIKKSLLDITAIFFSFLLFISSIFGSLIINKIGIRNALIYGLIGTAISNFFVFLGNVTEFFLLTVLSLSMTKIFIGIGAGGPAWFLMSKLIPPEMRNFSQAFSIGCILITTGICTYLYPILNTYLKFYTFIVLSTIPSTLISIILYLFLPELKNNTYHEVEYILKNKFFSGI